MGRHLDELAELYALGALAPEERTQVEAHVAGCATCAGALANAAATVAALDDAFVPQLEPPERLGTRIAASARAAATLAPERARLPSRRLPSSYATAAALLFAVAFGGGALVERSVNAREAALDSAIVSTIATSHFNHVTFTARTPAAPVSKVLYARDGAWFYVVIDGTTCSCRVVARSAAGERDYGAPAVRGTTATLFARSDVRPSAIELTSASGRPVSEATLVYAAR